MWERVKFWGGPRAGEIVWVFFNAGASKRVALDGPWFSAAWTATMDLLHRELRSANSNQRGAK